MFGLEGLMEMKYWIKEKISILRENKISGEELNTWVKIYKDNPGMFIELISGLKNKAQVLRYCIFLNRNIRFTPQDKGWNSWRYWVLKLYTQNFDFPLIRKIITPLSSLKIVPVQSLKAPSGNIFYLDVVIK